jgi:hypothetical protein
MLTNRGRRRQVRQAERWLASVLRRQMSASEQVTAPDAEDDTREWLPYTRADSVRDPDPHNYARYAADDNLRDLRSKADFNVWIERQREATPPKTFQDRLGEIATSEPFTDHEQMIDPETGEIADWWNSPEGLQALPPVLPRQPRTPDRVPGEPDSFFDVNDGGIKQQLPDGAVQIIYQAPAQEWN